MRGIVILISSEILISMITLIYNIVHTGNWSVTIVNCLILVLISLAVLIVICSKRRRCILTRYAKILII